MQNTNANFVIADECGFNLVTARTRGRARNNQRSSPSSDLHERQKLAAGLPKLSENRYRLQCFVVMGNAPVHNGAQIDENGHIVKKLAPYNPMLNTIEGCFNCVKENLIVHI